MSMYVINGYFLRLAQRLDIADTAVDFDKLDESLYAVRRRQRPSSVDDYARTSKFPLICDDNLKLANSRLLAIDDARRRKLWC
jgi:hypothetical protein